MTDTIEILKSCGALLEGHFLLSSGRHSDRYFQCARLFQHADRAATVLAPVADRIRADIAAGTLAVDVVVGPALGGIVAAYELGRQLGIPAFFTERDETGAMSLRRGFEVSPGMRILIAEDVVTTGKSSGESARVLEALGARVVALSCVVDRRAVPQVPQDSEAPGVEVSLPLYSACRVHAENWDAGDCALCKKGIPVVKPGSRRT